MLFMVNGPRLDMMEDKNCKPFCRSINNRLLKLADLWEKEAKSLTELECLNNGTPITQQLEVVEGLASEIRYHAGWCNKLDGRYANVHDPGIY